VGSLYNKGKDNSNANSHFGGQEVIKNKFFKSLLFLLLMVSVNASGAVDIQQSTSTSEIANEESQVSRTIVIGNKDTKRYHLPGMAYYNKVAKYHRVYFDSEQQAINNGYYKAGTGKDLAGHVPLASSENKKQDQPKTIEGKTFRKEKVVDMPVKLPYPVVNAGDTVFNYKIVVAFGFFIILFFLPFLPAIVEIIRKEDSDPLFIPIDNPKDPRYFGKSFRQLVQKGIEGLPAGPQISEVMLSKKENVQITESFHIPAAAQIENLLCVQGDMVSDVNVHFNKEVYVSGNSDIGPDNILHALAADGNITVAAGTSFDRWLDTQGNLDIGSNCNLGISASCGGRLHLADNCSFRRLYGMPVTTGDVLDPAEINPPEAWSADQSVTPESSFIRKTDSTVAEGSILNGHIIFLKDVRIGHHSIVNGSIKCYSDIELEENVTVYGNIFADGKITIGKGAIISGNVLAQNTILISEHSVISRAGVIKSVLGKKAVHLAPNVTIYGYVSTEGKGAVS
jgi:predicted acyltransferase (DUF342 family)